MLTRLLGWLIAGYVLLLRWTCRVRTHNDPRPGLRASGEAYAHAILHAQQIAIGSKAERGTIAMASQSADGQLLAPTFRALGVPLARGSNSRGGKARGGREALASIVQHVASGGNAVIAVDGPRGPRGCARKGVASLSKETGCPIVCVVVVPKWRLVMRKTWDRFQVPIHFTRYDAYFGEVIRPTVGESSESIRRRVEETLHSLETRHDPQEARHNQARTQAARLAA